ncbi:MAG: hypothetical protein CR997_04350 [Acidobacteria bacterium]|nr:MAG: hypothetical protein CR997_04350 [Acidobacteriota bacterium]
MKKKLLMIVVLSLVGLAIFGQIDRENRDNYVKRVKITELPDRAADDITPTLAPVVGQGILLHHVLSDTYGAFSTATYASTMFGTEGTFFSSWNSTTVENTSKALYVFDVSELTSASGMKLVFDGSHNSPSPINLAVYDAEDFGLQKLPPYTDADAESAFTSSGTPLDTQSFPPSGSVVFNVASAVGSDLGGGLSGFLLDIVESNSGQPMYQWYGYSAALTDRSFVPTLGQFGLIIFVGMFIVAGAWFLRRNR